MAEKKAFVLESSSGILGAFSNRSIAFGVVTKALGDRIYFDYSKKKKGSLPGLSRRLMLEKFVRLENSYGEWVKVNKVIINKEPTSF
jgi:hypothetical protein